MIYFVRFYFMYPISCTRTQKQLTNPETLIKVKTPYRRWSTMPSRYFTYIWNKVCTKVRRESKLQSFKYEKAPFKFNTLFYRKPMQRPEMRKPMQRPEMRKPMQRPEMRRHMFSRKVRCPLNNATKDTE